MKLIVGLGNPGKEFENTRHNIGFMVLDNYAKNNNLDFKKEKDGGIYVETIINGVKVILLKPQKYVNLSGEVLIKYINFYKIDMEDILVIHDDMAFELGTYKLRSKNNHGGHNGLRNILNHLKTNEFKRLRIGISKSSNNTIDYVIGKFSNSELAKLKPIIKESEDLINDFITLSFDNLMNKYNKN